MCKAWDLIYSCGHTFHIRLSKCRATVYTQSRPGRPFRPACLEYAALRFYKTCLCGDCASSERVEELNSLCASFEVGTVEREEADAESGRELLRVSKAYPAVEGRKRSKPRESCGRPPKELRGSLLRTEVRGEDVKADEEVNSEWTAYYEGWGQGWTATSSVGAEAPSWESVDVSEGAELVAWESEAEDLSHGVDRDNPCADDNEEMDSDLTPTPFCDAQISIGADSTKIKTENENAQTTSTHQTQPEEQNTSPTSASNPQPLLQKLPNGTSTTSPQTLPSSKLSNTRSAPITPTSVAFSDDQIKTTENHNFTTLPPHLRRRVVTLKDRRASTSDCNDSETLEQFKCFQLQTVIAVST